MEKPTTSRNRRRFVIIRGALVGVALGGIIALALGQTFATMQQDAAPHAAPAATAEQLDEQREAYREAYVRTVRVGDLIALHKCWTGPENMPSTMVGKVPGHAVYTLPARRNVPGAQPRVVYGPSKVGFSIWLDGKPGELHAFCR